MEWGFGSVPPPPGRSPRCALPDISTSPSRFPVPRGRIPSTRPVSPWLCVPVWRNISQVQNEDIPGDASRLHVVGQGHVVRPNVKLPFLLPEHPAMGPAGVDAHPHVHIDPSHLSNQPGQVIDKEDLPYLMASIMSSPISTVQAAWSGTLSGNPLTQ